MFGIEFIQVWKEILATLAYVFFYVVGCVIGAIVMAPKTIEEFVGDLVFCGILFVIFIIFTE